MHYRESELLGTDMPRIFEAVQMSLDPEDVPALVMSALHLRKLALEDPDDNPEVNAYIGEYDWAWDQLRQTGQPEPDVPDPRQAHDDCAVFGADTVLNPWAVFQPRERYLSFLKQRREGDRPALERAVRSTYEALSPGGNHEAADFLLGLVGARLSGSGRLVFDDLDQERLETVRELFAVLSPAFRDTVRINPLFFGAELDEALTGTDIEDPLLRESYRRFQEGTSP